MPTPGQGAIAALDYNDDERRYARAILSTILTLETTLGQMDLPKVDTK